jgi:UDP-N-acetylmuramoyl-L-alanyl-D-glutamate--2,6-diaminopimelate ligase
MWQGIAKKSACVGTTGIIDFDGKFEYERENFLTTPDSVKLHDILSQLAQKGVTHLAMEASSHGLDQYRLDGVRVEAAAFTNITRDHLDYHGSFEAYLEAKLRLFKDLLPEGKVAVLNADIDAFPILEQVCKERQQRIVSYGFKGEDIRFIEITPHTQGTHVKWSVFGKEYETDLKLIGQFQVYNLAAAIGLITAEKEIDVESLINILPSIEAVYGRMQLVAPGVFVDYAHTPDALENALAVLKPHTQGKLWVVFGCGGNRDEGKRPLMGKVAHNLADHVVITDDNPRHEKPDAIRQQIIEACPDAHDIADRSEAIAYAMKSMQEGDVLLVAGKGHEQYQIVGDEMRSYSDVNTIKELAV